MNAQKLENQQELYWNPNTLLSFNRYLNMITGARGIGKTYGIKKYLIKRFLKEGKQFIYLRRYKSHLKQSSLSKFFEKVALDPEFEGVKFSVKGNTFYINGKICGYAIPLSAWQNNKGSEFPEVETIFYDEFLKEKDNSQYLDNEPQALLSMAESVFREKIIMGTENVRIICASNSTSIANPFFIYFKLFPDINKRFNTFNHNKEILVEFPVMEAFKEKKLSGRFGELIKGTDYAKLSIENEFVYDVDSFIKKRTKASKFKFQIQYDGFVLGVWTDVKEGLMFLSNKTDTSTRYKFALTKEDFDEHSIYAVNYKEHYQLLRLVSAFKNGQLRFENQTIRNIGYDLFRKMNVK